ncbi:CBS domain-containing protein [Candidatus Woesearchaeota archaeon]|nr:CBS domain-containing protein [Candidatus Woesearchaeota archaeon]
MKINECKLEKPVYCKKEDSLVEVAKKLREHKIRHIVVVDKMQPVGIVAAVDIVNQVIAEGKDYKKMKAADVMVYPIFFVNKNDEVSAAYFGMVKRNTYSCPVVENNNFVGMLTFTEALKHLAKGKLEAAGGI